MALLIEYRALLVESRALLVECRALFATLYQFHSSSCCSLSCIHTAFVSVVIRESFNVYDYLWCTTDGGERTQNTTAKLFNTFSRKSSHTSKTFSRDSQKFQTIFQLSKRSPRHIKVLLGKPIDLLIQMFEVCSPPWVVWLYIHMITRYLHEKGFCT